MTVDSIFKSLETGFISRPAMRLGEVYLENLSFLQPEQVSQVSALLSQVFSTCFQVPPPPPNIPKTSWGLSFQSRLFFKDEWAQETPIFLTKVSADLDWFHLISKDIIQGLLTHSVIHKCHAVIIKIPGFDSNSSKTWLRSPVIKSKDSRMPWLCNVFTSLSGCAQLLQDLIINYLKIQELWAVHTTVTNFTHCHRAV